MKSYNGFTPSQRMKAYRWLMAEYEAGRRQQPTRCDACEQTEGLIQPHSEDYSAPFGEHIGRYGLCYRCHMILHCRFSAPTAWQTYVAVLSSGKRFPAMYSKLWGAFTRDHLGQRRIVTIDVGHPLPGFGAILQGEIGTTTKPT